MGYSSQVMRQLKFLENEEEAEQEMVWTAGEDDSKVVSFFKNIMKPKFLEIFSQ